LFIACFMLARGEWAVRNASIIFLGPESI